MNNFIMKSILIKPIALVLALCIFSISAMAGNRDGVVLPAGTSVRLETIKSLRSEYLTVGQIVDFRVVGDVMNEGKVLIANGTIAKGQVKRVVVAKGLGKAGSIEIAIETVPTVDGQNALLRGGSLYNEGEDKETQALLLGLLVCVLFLTTKGKNATVPQGTSVEAVVANNIEVNI